MTMNVGRRTPLARRIMKQPPQFLINGLDIA